MAGKDEFTESLVVPDELDAVIKTAIGRGKRKMRQLKVRARLCKLTGGLVVALAAALTVSVNVLPAFAESLAGIPGGAGLVKVLQFDRNRVSGGDITDGQDLGLISWEAGAGFERITLDLAAAGQPAGVPGYFEISQEQYPYRLVVALSGFRGFSALDRLPGFTGSSLVNDLHQMIIFDDSAVGFVINLKQPVQVTVWEQHDPARIIIDLAADPAAEVPGPVYTLRSASYPFGGGLGEIVESLRAAGEKAAMLRDQAGTFVAQAGYYYTEAAALAARERIEREHGIELYLELRGPADRPAAITP